MDFSNQACSVFCVLCTILDTEVFFVYSQCYIFTSLPLDLGLLSQEAKVEGEQTTTAAAGSSITAQFEVLG